MSAPPPAPRGRGRGRPPLTRGVSSRPAPSAASASPPRPPTTTTTSTPAGRLSPVAGADPSTSTTAPDFSRPLPPPRSIGTLRDPAAGPGAFRPGAGNLARKPEDLSKTGVSKLRFMPKLPVGRGKREPDDVKPPTPSAGPSAPTRGTHERGRGRGRGGPPPPGAGRGELQMTASGPFALGPSALLASNRPKPSGGGPVPVLGPPTPGAPLLGPGIGQPKRPALVLADAEQYSDEEAEVVDLDLVEGLDESAPSSLKRVRLLSEKERGFKREREREREGGAPRMERFRAKLELPDDPTLSLHSSSLPTPAPPSPPADALNLSDSDADSSPAEDLLPSFLLPQPEQGMLGLELDPEATRERVYFFQFPSPFPGWMPREGEVLDLAQDDVDMEGDAPPAPAQAQAQAGAVTLTAAPMDVDGPAGDKQVRFKPEDPTSSRKPGVNTSPGKGKEAPPPRVDGVIGRMELFGNGRVRIVLGEGIVMEVHPAADTSFLESLVHLDPITKQMTSLGAVEKRFVVSPDLDAMLGELEVEERIKREARGGGGGVKME